MSVKIYNGYYIPLMSLADLSKFCIKLGAELKAKKRELLLDFIVREFIYRKDAKISGIAGDASENVGVFLNDLEDRIRRIERSGQRDPIVDFESNAVFFPMADKILVLFYAERAEMRKIWESQPEVREYAYWNNTDWPEGMTAEQWKLRSEEWERALPDMAPPAQSGLSFVFTDLSVSSVLNGIGKHIEKHQVIKKDRVEAIARVMLEREFYQKRQAVQGDSLSALNAIESVRSFVDFEKSEAGAARFSELLNEVEKILPDRYSIDDISRR